MKAARPSSSPMPSRFGPSPSPDFPVAPSEQDVAFFREHGYVAVDRLTTDEELEWLAAIFAACFDPADDAAARTRWDTEVVAGDERETRSQASFPEMAVPELLDSAYRRNARRFVAAFLDVAPDDLTCWTHMLQKPAGIGRPTYWHQDEAYWEPALDYRAVGAWMPLHDCPVEMGCMQFLPGSHRGGVLVHHSRRPDIRPDLYEVVEPVDEAQAVACPLPAGGATFHHSRTLHYTAPNTTDQDRRAYAIEHETRPVKRAVPLDKPWVEATRRQLGRRRPSSTSPRASGARCDTVSERRGDEPMRGWPSRASYHPVVAMVRYR
jgi:ectoine hydroxylase-related dioxygenase (phytanoyl-CoA dioxygenase family)